MKQHLPNDALRELLAKTSINTLRTREAYARNAYMNQKLDQRSRLVRSPITKRGVHGLRWWRIIIHRILRLIIRGRCATFDEVVGRLAAGEGHLAVGCLRLKRKAVARSICKVPLHHGFAI